MGSKCRVDRARAKISSPPQVTVYVPADRNQSAPRDTTPFCCRSPLSLQVLMFGVFVFLSPKSSRHLYFPAFVARRSLQKRTLPFPALCHLNCSSTVFGAYRWVFCKRGSPHASKEKNSWKTLTKCPTSGLHFPATYRFFMHPPNHQLHLNWISKVGQLVLYCTLQLVVKGMEAERRLSRS